MSYYHTCPICGANLDPDEICSDCEASDENAREVRLERNEIQPAYSD